MRRWTNIIAAACIAVAVIAYFVIRGGVNTASEALAAAEVSEDATADDSSEDLFTVIAATPPREERLRGLSLSGRTEPARVVTLRAQTAGIVQDTPAREGDQLAAGEAACVLDVEAREARLAEARASVASARLDLTAARELAERGHRAAQQVAATQAAFDAAEAALAQARIELENTVINAPFNGVFDERLAEIGDYLSVGAACGVIAELDPLLIIAQAAERDIDAMAVGQKAQVVLATGEQISGAVRHIAFRANEDTRTFRVEIEAANPAGAIRAGLSANVRLQGPGALAARVPTSVLALSDQGALGVRTVDSESVVRFAPLEILEDTPEGVWVAGLPEGVKVIVRGQDFVTDGSRVNVLDQDNSES